MINGQLLRGTDFAEGDIGQHQGGRRGRVLRELRRTWLPVRRRQRGRHGARSSTARLPGSDEPRCRRVGAVRHDRCCRDRRNRWALRRRRLVQRRLGSACDRISPATARSPWCPWTLRSTARRARARLDAPQLRANWIQAHDYGRAPQGYLEGGRTGGVLTSAADCGRVSGCTPGSPGSRRAQRDSAGSGAAEPTVVRDARRSSEKEMQRERNQHSRIRRERIQYVRWKCPRTAPPGNSPVCRLT